jgi:hypothetical protein
MNQYDEGVDVDLEQCLEGCRWSESGNWEFWSDALQMWVTIPESE